MGGGGDGEGRWEGGCFFFVFLLFFYRKKGSFFSPCESQDSRIVCLDDAKARFFFVFKIAYSTHMD